MAASGGSSSSWNMAVATNVWAALVVRELSPADYPDELIVWSNTVPAVAEFVDGRNTGRAVTVHGLAEGETTLAVHVGDSRSDPPKFDLRVVTNATVNLRAWIIENKMMETAFSTDDIRRMVKDANDVYAQVGVTLNLIEPIVITNIPDAYDAFYNQPTDATATWSFFDIVDIATNTGGLECYFINSFVDSTDTLAANHARGMVLTSDADFLELSHEIGHAFGMHDIYDSNRQRRKPGNPLIELAPSDMACKSNMSYDWNGGCKGQGRGGTRYYKAGTAMSDIISRMLMNGLHGSAGEERVISAGPVFGVHFTYDDKDNKVWLKGKAPVGFPWYDRNPTHK